MGTACTNGLTGRSTRDSITMIRSKVLVYIHGQMGNSTKATGNKANIMVKVYTGK